MLLAANRQKSGNRIGVAFEALFVMNHATAAIIQSIGGIMASKVMLGVAKLLVLGFTLPLNLFTLAF